MTDNLPAPPNDEGRFLPYQSEDGQTRIAVRIAGETVWLTQAQMAALFQTTVPNINIHVQNVFKEGGLRPERTITDYLQVPAEGARAPGGLTREGEPRAEAEGYHAD